MFVGMAVLIWECVHVCSVLGGDPKDLVPRPMASVINNQVFTP